MARIGAALESAGTDDPVEAMRATRPPSSTPPWTRGGRGSLIDAPSVLGWAERREIDARFGLGLAEAALTAAMEAGRIRRQPVRPLAHLLLAAMGEAGDRHASAPDPASTRREVER